LSAVRIPENSPMTFEAHTSTPQMGGRVDVTLRRSGYELLRAYLMDPLRLATSRGFALRDRTATAPDADVRLRLRDRSDGNAPESMPTASRSDDVSAQAPPEC
jgi:hypothetical protein